MPTLKWGIIGCGDVCEVKSGPGFYKANNSELISVMRRNGDLAADFAKRHNVSHHTNNADEVINHPEINAIYIATPPSSHCDYALQVAEAGKLCYVEKPMAMNHRECIKMVDAFKSKNVPLYVAYYRRGLPRFIKVRDLLQEGAIGQPTSVHIVHYGKLATGEKAKGWRYDPAIAGAGTFLDLASHGLDILDFLISPIKRVSGFAINTGKAYNAEDATVGAFEFESGVVGTGVWNFNANHSADYIVITGTQGELKTPVFADTDIILTRNSQAETFSAPNPEHVHQPLIQSIVDEQNGQGQCPSTGESGARASWAMDQCLRTYYGKR